MIMLERIARVIGPDAFRQEATAREFVESAGKDWEGSYEQGVHQKKLAAIYEKARAVLAALREPTEGMLAAFNRHCDENGQCLVKTGYRAMIDAALEEGKQ